MFSKQSECNNIILDVGRLCGLKRRKIYFWQYILNLQMCCNLQMKWESLLLQKVVNLFYNIATLILYNRICVGKDSIQISMS